MVGQTSQVGSVGWDFFLFCFVLFVSGGKNYAKNTKILLKKTGFLQQIFLENILIYLKRKKPANKETSLNRKYGSIAPIKQVFFFPSPYSRPEKNCFVSSFAG